ncbi:hypothetical protein LJC23_05605 [Desulfovibrio sp. OttesenSCG-928-I05]|nr:hypothetical protein [Desulfovibrio sp. OttesenSCG-928-I05]
MKNSPVRTAARYAAALALFLFFSTPLAHAGAADALNGVWVADIDATLVELAKTRKEAMRDYEMDDLKAMLAALRMTIDIPGMRFTENGPNGSEASFTIETIEEDGDTIRILGDRRRYSCTIRPDGTLYMGSGVVMHRAGTGTDANAAQTPASAQTPAPNTTPNVTQGGK